MAFVRNIRNSFLKGLGKAVNRTIEVMKERAGLGLSISKAYMEMLGGKQA